MTGAANLEVQDRIATVRLSNPARRNAIDLSLARDLADIAEALERRSDVTVVVIRGDGDKAFCAGIDVKYADATGNRVAAFADLDRQLERAAAAFDRCPAPIIALLRGPCIGGGVIVASWADLRIGAGDLNLAIPAIANNLVYPHDGMRRLARIIGLQRMKQVFYEGRPMSPATLLNWGALDYLFPTDDFDTASAGIISTIAAQPHSMLARYRVIFASLMKE